MKKYQAKYLKSAVSFTFFFTIIMSLFVSCSKIDAPMTTAQQNLRVNLRKEPVSLDPRKGNDMVASQLHFMLFEGLLKLKPDLTLSCAQAESYTISEDGKTYTFHLRDSKWSDGTPVTAYDFEKSWKSLLDPMFPCPDAYLLYPVKNAQAAKKGQAPLYQVGIMSKNPKTLVVELESPTSHFLQVVASSVLLPINFQVEAKEPDWAESPTNFVSNGPFILKDWKLNREITLEKNPRYLNASEVKLDQVTFEIIDNEASVLHLYFNGHFDLIGSPLSFVPEAILHDQEKRKELHYFPVASTKFLAFNTSKFPLNNRHLRQALAHAIPRKEIIEHITQLHQKEALNILPSALMRKSTLDLIKDNDTATAKALLKKALSDLGIAPQDLSISLMYVSSGINQSIALKLQDEWSKTLGIRVQLENVEFKQLHDRSKKSDFDIGVFAWLADYNDPMNILERFQDKASPRNYSKWTNERYNHLLQLAKQSSSPQVYAQMIQEAERFLIEEMPITGLYHDNYAFLINPRVKGFAISPLGHIYFESLWLD